MITPTIAHPPPLPPPSRNNNEEEPIIGPPSPPCPSDPISGSQTQQTQISNVDSDDDGTPPILFSCKCESARPVTTLLSCLRNVTSSSITNATADITTNILAGVGGGGNSTQQTTSNQHSSNSTFGGRGSKVQYATVFVSDKSLTFQVHGVGKQSRATVDMHAGLFSEFHVAEQIVPFDLDDDDDDEEESNNNNNEQNGEKEKQVEVIKGGEFGINLTTVLECLCVLGPNALDRTSLCLSYNTHTATFRIELLESFANSSVIISNCEIPGMAVADDDDDDEYDTTANTLIPNNNDNDENNNNGINGIGSASNNLDYAFRSYPILARALIKSEFLKDAISELTDVGGSTTATIGISKSGLEFATHGHSTECHVVVPYVGNHPETFISLEGVDNGNNNINNGSGGGSGVRRNNGSGALLHTRNYPLHSILSAMRGLEIACETCISINANGMVAIQHQVLDSVGKGNPNFIEFIMCCLEDEFIDDQPTFRQQQSNGIRRTRSGSGDTHTTDGDDTSVFGDDASTGNSINGFIVEDDETITIAPATDDERGQTQFSQSQTSYHSHKNSRQQSSRRGDYSQLQSDVTLSATIEQQGHNHDSNESSQQQHQHSSTSTALFGTVANIGGISELRNKSAMRQRNYKKKQNYQTAPKSSSEDNDDDDITNKQSSRQKKRQKNNPSTLSDGPKDDKNDKNTEDEEDSDDNDSKPPVPQFSQGEETELDDDEVENSLDVTATVTTSSLRRRSGGNYQEEEEISSSPQLMYGDTHLEGSGDEDGL